MRGDGKHRLPAAVAIEQPIDQMQIARPTTTGAHRQLAGHRGFGPGGECRHLFVAHMHPFDALHLAQRIGQPVETIAGHPQIRSTPALSSVSAMNRATVFFFATMLLRFFWGHLCSQCARIGDVLACNSAMQDLQCFCAKPTRHHHIARMHVTLRHALHVRYSHTLTATRKRS